jgi:hypothetical protein
MNVKGDNWGTSSYEFDAQGNMIKSVDPSGEVSHYFYNSIGKQVWQYQPSTDTTAFYYNGNLQLTKQVGAKGEIHLSYDNINRVVERKFYDHKLKLENKFKYTFDDVSASSNSAGRLSKVTGDNYSHSFNYDQRGNVLTKEVRIDGLADSYVQAFSYDADNRMVKTYYPDSSHVKYEYTHGNKVGLILKGSDTLASYSDFTAWGKVGEIKYSNGVSSAVAYDLWGRMTSTLTEKKAFQMYQGTYQWNNANKLLGISDQRDVKETDLAQTFGYSQGGRLLNATGVYGTETYAYNQSGDRTAYNDLSYVYNSTKKHQLDKVKKGSSETASYTYTESGTLKDKETKAGAAQDTTVKFKYNFNANNSLKSVLNSDDTIASFWYSDNGNRIAQFKGDTQSVYYVSGFMDITVLSDSQVIYTQYVQNAEGVVYAESKNGNGLNLMDVNSALSISQGVSKPGIDAFVFMGNAIRF